MTNDMQSRVVGRFLTAADSKLLISMKALVKEGLKEKLERESSVKTVTVATRGKNVLVQVLFKEDTEDPKGMAKTILGSSAKMDTRILASAIFPLPG